MSPKIGRSHRWDDQTRREFFLRVDRGSSVRTAALSLGISVDLAYKWRSDTGIAAKRPAPRIYTERDKAEFFGRLAVNRNVTAVARELGFVRVTCFKWAHEAGIFTSRDADERKRAFFALRADGVPRAQAARQLKIAPRQAVDWDKGIRQFPGGRVYPDGRTVYYNQESQGNMSSTTSAYLNAQVKLIDLERTISRRYLDLSERERIHDRRAAGASICQIARELQPARRPSAASSPATPPSTSATSPTAPSESPQHDVHDRSNASCYARVRYATTSSSAWPGAGHPNRSRDASRRSSPRRKLCGWRPRPSIKRSMCTLEAPCVAKWSRPFVVAASSASHASRRLIEPVGSCRQ